MICSLIMVKVKMLDTSSVMTDLKSVEAQMHKIAE